MWSALHRMRASPRTFCSFTHNTRLRSARGSRRLAGASPRARRRERERVLYACLQIYARASGVYITMIPAPNGFPSIRRVRRPCPLLARCIKHLLHIGTARDKRYRALSLDAPCFRWHACLLSFYRVFFLFEEKKTKNAYSFLKY